MYNRLTLHHTTRVGHRFFKWTKFFVKKDVEKTKVFFWTNDFIEKNGFTEQMILLNDRSERKRMKSMEMNGNFKNEHNQIFLTIEKTRTKWVIQERWMNEMKKDERAHIYTTPHQL